MLQGGPYTASQSRAAKLASVFEGAQILVASGETAAHKADAVLNEESVLEPMDVGMAGSSR